MFGSSGPAKRTSHWKTGMNVSISLAFSIFAFLAVAAPVTAGPDVIGNPEQIRFEGTGGLILPSSVDSQTRNRVAKCRDCSWKITPACVPGPENYCDALIRACPGLIDHVRTWFRPAGGEWVETGLICLTSNRVTTVNTAERLIADEFTRYIPDLKPKCWPDKGVVTNIPYVCTSGQQSGVHRWSHELVGLSVSVEAKPSWVWEFGNSYLVTEMPGGPYPDTSVSHVFTQTGRHKFPVTAVWRGQFSVDGVGPFNIEAALRQQSHLSVEVGEARGRLTN